MSDDRLSTLIFAAPFLALCAGGLVAQIFAIKSEVARIRSARVVARDGGRQ